MTAGNRSGETEIRELAASWVQALHDKDVDARTAGYADDVVVFDVMGPGPTAGTQVIFSLLHQALEASTQADVQYRNWNAALAGSSSAHCSTDPSAAAALTAAHSYDSTASTYKAQFVALFNPLAAQVGLPPWSATAF